MRAATALTALTFLLFAVRRRSLAFAARGKDHWQVQLALGFCVRFCALATLMRVRRTSRALKALADKELLRRTRFDDVREGPASDALLLGLAKSCPSLGELRLTSRSRVTDSGLLALSGHTLTAVQLSGLPFVTDAGLDAICSCNLMSLVLADLRRISLQGLARCTRLQSLGLERVNVDMDLLALANGVTSLALLSFPKLHGCVVQRCPKLVSLNVSSSGLASDFLEQCPALEWCSANYCQDFGDEECARVATMSASKLLGVSLNGCDNVSDSGAKALATHCPNLCHANFSQTLVTSQGLVTLALALPHLRVLHFGGTFVEDQGLRELALAAQALTSLGCSRCPRLSSQAMADILRQGGFPKLRVLSSSFDPSDIAKARSIQCVQEW